MGLGGGGVVFVELWSWSWRPEGGQWAAPASASWLIVNLLLGPRESEGGTTRPALPRPTEGLLVFLWRDVCGASSTFGTGFLT